MSHQVKQDIRNSLDDSWATISISEDSENSSALSELDNLMQPRNNNSDGDETNLDETIPIDELDEMDTPDGMEPVVYVDVNCPLHTVPSRVKPDYLWGTPVPPKDMKEFRPVYCSSSIQLAPEDFRKSSISFDFTPQFCSSKLENQRHCEHRGGGTPFTNKPSFHADPEENHYKQPGPFICELSKLKPHLRSVTSSLRMGSEEFKPQRCSTALSESQFKSHHHPAGSEENSNVFVPLRSSTGIAKTTSFPMPLTPGDFAPNRCSTGLNENSVAFLPLRCSTGLNDSAAFNPPMSSTFQKVEDSNILEFKYLRLHSEKNLGSKK